MLNISTDYDVDVVVEFVDIDGDVVGEETYNDVKLDISIGLVVHEVKKITYSKYYLKVDHPRLWDENVELFK